MTAAPHRIRTFLLAVLFALLLLALFARRTSAGWNGEPMGADPQQPRSMSRE